jgi:hypothetical protein
MNPKRWIITGIVAALVASGVVVALIGTGTLGDDAGVSTSATSPPPPGRVDEAKLARPIGAFVDVEPVPLLGNGRHHARWIVCS